MAHSRRAGRDCTARAPAGNPAGGLRRVGRVGSLPGRGRRRGLAAAARLLGGQSAAGSPGLSGAAAERRAVRGKRLGGGAPAKGMWVFLETNRNRPLRLRPGTGTILGHRTERRRFDRLPSENMVAWLSGRASPSHGGGHRFKSCSDHHEPSGREANAPRPFRFAAPAIGGYRTKSVSAPIVHGRYSPAAWNSPQTRDIGTNVCPILHSFPS